MCKKCVAPILMIFVLGVAASSTVAAEDPNLVGWWTLDDGSGPLASESTGTSVDASLVGDPVWLTDGVHGGSLLFDGTDDYMFIDGHFRLPVYTMSVWFRADASGQRDILSAYEVGVQHGILLEQQAGGTLRFLHRFPLGTGGGTNVYSTDAYDDGAWHNVVLTKSETEIVLYVDGQEIGRAPDNSVFNPTDSFGVAVGTLDNERELQRMWLGAIDDVRIYNRPITPEDVAMLSFRPKAHTPDPANGALDVGLSLLRWSAGTTAMFHDVYVGTSPDLTEADLVGSRIPFTMFFSTAGFEPGATYWWRVDEIEADGTTVYTGDVWSFIAQDVTAYYPQPVDGAVDVSPAPTLTWQPGKLTVAHNVFFSDDVDAVTQGAAEADQGTVEEAAFTPEPLETVKTYYWRVDETVADNTVQAGPVWSFTTHLPVDDFEAYTDDEGSRIYETWIDGWTNGTGSTAGNLEAPFAEQTVVRSPIQSMPLDYNNVNSPFYSEAEREFDPAQDWTISDLGVLTVHYRGRMSNGQDQLYVVVEDSAGKAAVAVHPDPQAVWATRWTEWKIPFSELAGVDLASVSKLYIGMGDRDNPTAGGSGRIYVDDIYVARP